MLAVVGPTASGKTDLALELAGRLGGELISADSRQLYRHLDAGTAKPEGRWEGGVYRVRGIPYHLIDALDPSEPMDAARFAGLAGKALEGAVGRGAAPILVGGTGLYLRALLEGLDPLPPRDPALRERLQELAELNGRSWLHERLGRVDPGAAARIPPNNLQRVVRALEVFELTGKPISSLWTGASSRTDGCRPRSAALYLGVQWERAALAERIHARCRAMFPAILEEVSKLVPARYTGREPGFRSLGYPEALDCLAGRLSREKALDSMIRRTLDYAKRQATWFRGQAAVLWIPAGAGEPGRWADAALARVGRGRDGVSRRSRP